MAASPAIVDAVSGAAGGICALLATYVRPCCSPIASVVLAKAACMGCQLRCQVSRPAEHWAVRSR